MKKVMRTMVMLLASAVVLTSCGNDDVKDVELTLIPSATSGTHFVNYELKITLNAKGNSDNKLKSLTIIRARTGASPQTVYTNQNLSGTDFILDFKDSLSILDTVGVTYTFTLNGAKGNASVKNYLATVKQIGLLDVLEIPVTLKGQTNSTAPLHFMKLTSPFTPYSTSVTESELITCDLAFYFGSSNLFTISSPSDNVMQSLYSGLLPIWSKNVVRTTGFYKAGPNDLNYNTIATEEIDVPIVNYAAGKTFTNTITKLVTGDIILFKTATGKLGLIRVKAVNPATNQAASNASIDLEMVAQAN
jgi:hypothetical protein